MFTTEYAKRNTNTSIHQVKGQQGRRCDFAVAISELKKFAPLFNNASDVQVLEILSRSSRIQSVCESSQGTYGVAVRRFFSFLDVTHQSFDSLVESKTLPQAMLPYVTYLFIFQNLAYATIKTYVAGLQYYLFTNNLSSSIWSPQLHQSLKGFLLRECREKPLSERSKLPVTLSMIFWGRDHILSKISSPFLRSAFLASLCVGFMFLFRKSEYLTGPDRRPKSSYGVVSTLTADFTHFWFDDIPFPAHSRVFPVGKLPSMMSMYLPLSKGDPLGKGATRFFPADVSNPDCLVRLAFEYISQAMLQPTDCLFAGPRMVITADMVSGFIKLIAIGNGLPEHRYSPHSIRVGGLVTLMAADVPDNLKQLAGRWANPKSFLAYARATLQQFNTISRSLNNKFLVTSDEVKRFYVHTK